VSILNYVREIHSQLIFLKTSSKLYFLAYPDIQKLLGAHFKLYYEDWFKCYPVKSHLNSNFNWLEFMQKFKAKGTCLENTKFH